jgi:hypothetical protein
MERLPAVAGWHWVKQGFALFRRQPAEMSMLFMLYVFLTGLIGVVPIVGLILRFALVPVFSMAFMQACANIEQGKRVLPKVLFVGFRSPAFKSLLILGVLYLLAAILALLVTSIVDDGAIWQAINSEAPPDVKTVGDSSLLLPMLFAAMAYLSISLMLWYAAPLIAWQNMGVGKAIFFSIFAVIRAFKAFLFYLFAWMMIGLLLIFAVSVLLRVLIDNMETEIFILFPLVLLVMAVVQCSFYPSYTQIFGAPQLPEETEPPGKI